MDLTIPVPSADPTFGWLLCTAAGHLFAYHVAKAIDATGIPLRRALEELERLVDDGAEIRPDAAGRSVAGHIDPLLARAVAGDLRGVLSSSSVLALSGLVDAADAVARRTPGRGLRWTVVSEARLALVDRSRRADPLHRHHQAPGEDGHGRYLPG